MFNKISSKDNQSFKYAKKLFEKSSFRKNEKKFIVEGLREIDLCQKSDFEIESIFTLEKNVENLNHKNINVISNELLRKIIYRETEGIFAIVNDKKQDINSIKLTTDELILVLENPEKPGNIGAIMRTFEACGFKNIIIVDSNLELYNPNTIRSSLGSIFHLNVFKMNSNQIIDFLKKNNFKIYSSFIESKNNFNKIDYNKRCAIVMGPEKSSINQTLIKKSDELLSIPMFGKVDSLNLSVSTGIILYEALNQRKFS